MSCRKYENGEMVWFNSIGTNIDGTAKFVENGSFAEKQDEVATSLTQRLSTLKGELWYNISYGLPLLDKIRSKIELDSFVLSVINSHKDVRQIIKYESNVDNHTYHFKANILSEYGEFVLEF